VLIILKIQFNKLIMVEALGSVSASEAYQEFEKRNNRFVNMLTDNVSY
jgi:hypothetical protein